MAQEITLRRTDDHYTMQFGGNDSEYPVPAHAIETLDDDFTPEEVGESITFVGDYGGHKHAKSFNVEEVIDGLNDDDDETTDEAGDMADEQSVRAGVPDAVPATPEAQGMVQQLNVERLFASDDEMDDERISKSDFDFVCPNCGGDANDSTVKPYCSSACEHEDLAGEL